jgi:hypothetical protein
MRFFLLWPFWGSRAWGNKKALQQQSLLIKVTTMGFEPIRLAAPPPQDGKSTNFSTWPESLNKKS